MLDLKLLELRYKTSGAQKQFDKSFAVFIHLFKPSGALVEGIFWLSSKYFISVQLIPGGRLMIMCQLEWVLYFFYVLLIFSHIDWSRVVDNEPQR